MSPPTPKPEGTILYVDDTEAQRYAVSRVLRNAGFHVLEARTGQQALDMSNPSPDVIILDVNLPDISGIEVCKRLKAGESTARTPIMQVSATAVSTEARVAGLEGGADAYLTQPIEPQELVATVRALLRVRRSEEQLWKSQVQYRSFFEANPLPCLVFDTSDLRILTVNAAAIQHYGYSREEFASMTPRDLVAPEDEAAFLQALTETDSSKHSLHTWNHVTKAGKVIDVEMTWAPLQLNSENVRLAILQDITEKQALQIAQHHVRCHSKSACSERDVERLSARSSGCRGGLEVRPFRQKFEGANLWSGIVSFVGNRLRFRDGSGGYIVASRGIGISDDRSRCPVRTFADRRAGEGGIGERQSEGQSAGPTRATELGAQRNR